MGEDTNECENERTPRRMRTVLIYVQFIIMNLLRVLEILSYFLIVFIADEFILLTCFWDDYVIYKFNLLGILFIHLLTHLRSDIAFCNTIFESVLWALSFLGSVASSVILYMGGSIKPVHM